MTTSVNPEALPVPAINVIREAIARSQPAPKARSLSKMADTVLNDVVLLARCAKSRCLITYSSAIAFRGHGNQQSGKWLDDVFMYAIKPLGFPDLTMLVVNKATKKPSPEAFDARRSILSKIYVEDVAAEQLRCVWFNSYESVLGPLDLVPSSLQLVRLQTDEPAKEREISRAVSNAMLRVNNYGNERISLGKEYPNSLSRSELIAVAISLWERQQGRCALTGTIFELRGNNDGGLQDDRVSIDRIDNRFGYSEDNIQLVTQFANRARGTLSISEARRRLVQFD